MSSVRDVDGLALVQQAYRVIREEGIGTKLGLTEEVARLFPQDGRVALSHAVAMQEGGRGEFAQQELIRAAKLEPDAVIAAGMDYYLRRRQRVAEGSGYGNGWISFLEIVLYSGYLPRLSTRNHVSVLSDEAMIPKRILQFWDAPQPPAQVGELMDRVRDMHPDFEYLRLDDASALAFIDDHYDEQVGRAYRLCQHPSAKSDLIRLAYLYRMGGFYIDADELCLDHLGKHYLLPGVNQIFTYSAAGTACVNNWFIGVAPNDPLIGRAMTHCVENLLATEQHGTGPSVWVLTGPGNLTFSILDDFCRIRRPGEMAPFSNACFFDEMEYRTVFDSPPLDYKAVATGNWRL